MIAKRVGPPVAVTCFEDLAPPPPKESLVRVVVRDHGGGRPTKRERRQLERLRPGRPG